MQRHEMSIMAAAEQRREIAKTVAALLAENAATVSEIDTIFNMAKEYVIVTLRPDLQPTSKASASVLAPGSDNPL